MNLLILEIITVKFLQIGTYLGMKDVFYNKDCPATILSMGKIVKQCYEISYVGEENISKANKEREEFEFGRKEYSNLYYLKAKSPVIPSEDKLLCYHYISLGFFTEITNKIHMYIYFKLFLGS